MKSVQLAAFVESIRNSGLLGAEPIEFIARSAADENADAQAIAKEIVHRDWLTAFQVKMFWKGKGADLFINQYVLVDRLGEGGMGEVYKAHHRKMDRYVALKVIRKERLSNVEAVKRFHREIRAAAQLTHENVVMAYDADRAGERHFFVMEYVDGSNLAKWVKENGPLSVADACEYIRQAALGLQHAFEKGMVHRDVKPSNLLLGKKRIVKILDMGLARLQESPTGETESRLTTEGLVIGTPDFLAPEQARNAHGADIRADIYALGSTFYFLLIGTSPYPTGTPTEKMIQHSVEPIPSVNRPDMPPALEQILHRMMAKKPQDRYQTPAEVALALEPYCGLPASFTSTKVHAIAAAPVALPQANSLSYADADPSTDSQFRLPPPIPAGRRKKKADPNRWFVPIAVGVGCIVLALFIGGIYVLTRSKPSTDEGLDSRVKIPLGNNANMDLARIAPGSFTMGSSDHEEGHQPDEGPTHEVELTKPFYLGISEVTIRQYQALMGSLPRSFVETLPKDKDYAIPEEELDCPITVTHKEAETFIARLNKDDKKSRKPGWEFRLPTEAEWEFSCRAGTKTRFSYGSELDPAKAVWGELERKKPAPVGQRPANAWGLYDMHGNVAEWCFDHYDDGFYAASPVQDPMGGDKRFARFVIRGGGWNNTMTECRSAKRRADFPEKPSAANVGFRVAMVRAAKE